MVDVTSSRLIDGGSNVCVVCKLHHMVDVVNIEPVPISVAQERVSSSFNDCIIACGLLPLTLSNGITYYQGTSGHISPGVPYHLFAHVVTVFFVRHVTFWQWTLAARHDCNFNILVP